MGLIERIDAYEKEAEDLDTLLSPVLDSLMEAHGWPRKSSWYLKEFYTTIDGCIKLTAEDSYDCETKSFTIPASVVESGKVSEYCTNLKDEFRKKKALKEEANKRAELSRIEARARILRGQLNTN